MLPDVQPPESWAIVPKTDVVQEGDRYSLDTYRVQGKPVWHKVNLFHVGHTPDDIPGITFIRKTTELSYEI